MRVAAIYDIHGNLPALEAVLDEIREAGVDQILVGGDVVPGPMPREALARLLDVDLPIQFIYGNGEVAVLTELAGKEPRVPPNFRDVIRWNAQQLADYEKVLSSWPKTIRLEVPSLGEVLFCHATPQNENDVFTKITPEEWLLPIFQQGKANIVVCGHTHMQFDRMIGKTRVANAGSVGMPFGKPDAYWLLLSPNIQLCQTDYDLVKAAERIRATNYPQANEFAEHNILQPPSEAEMLEAFAKTELRG
jgi:predicted phosphodiesterase